MSMSMSIVDRIIAKPLIAVYASRTRRETFSGHDENCPQNATDHKDSLVTRMWANAQPDGRPAEHRWRPLFNAPKFG